MKQKKVVHRIPKDFYLVSKKNRIFIDKKKEENLKECRKKVDIEENLEMESTNNRITPDNITELKGNEIFVFGSNEAGRHGKGAAKTAMKWGARYGQGFGIWGNTFAIPTMDKNIHKLKIERVERWINKFYQAASCLPYKKFLVTEIGCGLAGFKVKEIAPLFKECSKLENVYLPHKFWKVLEHEL
jgi:hypothetical protein